MTQTSFQRARSLEAKAQRTEDLLLAAAHVLEADGIDGLTLQAIASRAGVVKSNIYRYFESREAILVALLLREFENAVDTLETMYVSELRVEETANRLVGMFAERPLLCELMCHIGPTLERNISIESVRDLKRQLLKHGFRAGAALCRALPWLNEEEAFGVFFCIHTFIAGLWPNVTPVPILAQVYEEPEFVRFKRDFDKELYTLLAVHLAGLKALKATVA